MTLRLLLGTSLAFLLAVPVAVPAFAAPGKPSFPLRVSESGRFFVDQDREPFLYFADTAWSLMWRLSKEEVLRYFQTRTRQGFTAVQAHLLPRRTAGVAAKNRFGQAPFQNERDFAQPNEAYFAHVDWVLEKAASSGLLVSLAPAWLGCCDDGWFDVIKAHGAQGARAYGQYLGRRFRRFDNVLWQHGGDRAPLETSEEVKQLALGIKETAPAHLHTLHHQATSQHVRPTRWGDDDWLDFNTFHTSEDVHPYVANHYFPDPPRPVVLAGTGALEDEVDPDGRKSRGMMGEPNTQHRVRRQHYAAMLRGAAGVAFGHATVAEFAPGWQKALGSPGTRQAEVLGKLLRSRAWWAEPPARGMVGPHKFVAAGDRAPSRAPYKSEVSAAISDDMRGALVFVPTARPSIKLDLGRLFAPVTGRWLDPASGTFRQVPGGPFANRGLQEFTLPGKTADGQADFLLVLEEARGRPTFHSMDFRGLCDNERVPRGLDGRTTVLYDRGFDVEAYGQWFGYHCAEDQGRLVYTEMTNDFDVSVRLEKIGNEYKTMSEAGIMVRKSLDPGAEFVAMSAGADRGGGGGLFTFGIRTKPKGSLRDTAKGIHDSFMYSSEAHTLSQRRYPNVWLRLQRGGDSYLGSWSADGVAWTTMGSFTMPLGERLVLGLFVSPTPEQGVRGKATARFTSLRGFPVIRHGDGKPKLAEAGLSRAP